MSPPDHALVLCVEEKSQVQALDRSQLLPLQPGSPERRTHDYYRHGTTSLFAALDVATGAVIGKCLRTHRHQEFLAFLRHLDRTLDTQSGQEIHLVMDNYATHKTPAVRRWFQRDPDYHVHFTRYERQLAQPDRTVLRRDHDAANSPQRLPQRRRS